MSYRYATENARGEVTTEAVHSRGNVNATNIALNGVFDATGTYTVENIDHIVRCDGTFTVTLPSDPVLGQEHEIKNLGTGTITVSSSDDIDGSASRTLSTQYQCETYRWVGSTWDLIANGGPAGSVSSPYVTYAPTLANCNNTSTETTVVSQVIAGDEWQDNQKIIIDMVQSVMNTDWNGYDFRVKFGGQSLTITTSGSSSLPGGITMLPLRLELFRVGNQILASDYGFNSGKSYLANGVGGIGLVVQNLSGTIDFTTSNTLEVTIQHHSTASLSRLWTMNMAIISKVSGT